MEYLHQGFDIEEDLLFGDHSVISSVNIAKAIVQPPVVINLKKGETHELETEDYFSFLIPLRGTFTLSIPMEERKQISAREFLLFGFYTFASLSAEQEDGAFLRVNFSSSIQLCVGECPKIKCLQHECMPSINKESDKEILPKADIQSLKQVPIVQTWAEMVAIFVTKEHTNTSVYEYKLRELFYILRHFYTKEEQDCFLSSFHCKNHGFRAFVYNHHMECRTVEELANLLDMSLSTFKRTFRQEFGSSPLQWMHKQKANYIYRDLRRNCYSLAEMAERYHFSSVSYFCAFCKKIFNETPMKISTKGLSQTKKKEVL